LNEIRIEGLNQLEAQFGRIEKGLNKAAKETLMKQAILVRDRIKEKAPLGPTGNLKRSSIAKMMPDKPNYPLLAIAGIDRKIAPHAHLVEFGHAGPHPAPAHPFFRPAIAETFPRALENIKTDLKEGIERQI
jgi:HK97 gp10 family phage protein